MTHEIHQTRGIILERRNFGEAEKLYIIFTEQLGKIAAVAQGVRNIKSKLRYSLEPLSLVNFALVATGERWRIVDADKVFSFVAISGHQSKMSAYLKLVTFLNRMLQGQEENKMLWNQLISDLDFLEAEDLNDGNLGLLEATIVARILHNLGYLNRDDFSFLVDSCKVNSEVLLEAAKNKGKLISAINESIKLSHL